MVPGPSIPPNPSNRPGWGAGGHSIRHPFEPDGGQGPVTYIVPVPMFVGGSDDQNAAPPVDEINGEPPPQPQAPPLAAVPPPMPDPSTAFVQHAPIAAPAASSEKVCSQPPQPDPVHFFIALKDGLVVTALAYWILGDTLHYLTLQGIHNMVSLDLVNRKLSARLNGNGPIELILPQH